MEVVFKWGDCAKSVSAVFVAAFTAGTVLANTGYSVADRVLTIDVPPGETNSVALSEISCANNNEVTNIVKIGQGAIVMDQQLDGYLGDINIRQGMWVIAATNALGKLSSNQDCSGVGAVFVEDGGSLAVGATDRNISNAGKKIWISGQGVNGEGALTVIPAPSGKGAYTKGVFGKNVELAGDALIGQRTPVDVYFTQAYTEFRLNGNKLSFNYPHKNSYVIGGTTQSEIIAPGEVELSGKSKIIFQGRTVMAGGEGKLTFKDTANFSSSGMRGRYEWPMEWDSAEAVQMLQQTTGDIVTNRNTWHGPVRLQRNMKVNISKSGTFGLFGPVSGPGGLDMFYSETSKSAIPTNFVNLSNTGSSFSGGVRISDLILNVMARDAIPQDGGTLVMTNSVLNFDRDKNYALPSSVIHVKDGSAMPVNGGSGKWKTLVKTGAGTVQYNSAVGAEILEIKDGTFAVNGPGLRGFAGLIEGVEYFEANGDAYRAAENKEMAWTNHIVFSPHVAYSNNTYWTHLRPASDEEAKLLQSSATVYSGYMWNREPTNVNWTFCCNVGTVSFFHLDDKLIFSDGDFETAQLATVENVTRGWHKFRFGSYAPFGKGGPGKGIKNYPDWNGLGFRWDPLGRNSPDVGNFVELKDPGDGSLFTWAVPGDDVFYPGTDESNKIGYLPRFDAVKFAESGLLELNVDSRSVATAEGFPRVGGVGALTVEKKWILDAADVVAGMKTTGANIVFGADVELEVENPMAARRVSGVREWTVLESLFGIVGSISVKDPETAKRWTVAVDGDSIKLKYRPVGLVMVIH